MHVDHAGFRSRLKGARERHQWFSLEIHKRLNMDMSAAEMKRAATAQSASSQSPIPGTRRPQWLGNPRPLPAGRGASSTSGATPVVRCCTSTTRSTSRTASSTCWSGMSRLRCTPLMALPGRPVKSALRWSRRPGRHECHHRHRDRLHGLDPMVVITGQVPTPAIGLDAFQECDTVGITRPS